jgi:hypothetical protein
LLDELIQLFSTPISNFLLEIILFREGIFWVLEVDVEGLSFLEEVHYWI